MKIKKLGKVAIIGVFFLAVILVLGADGDPSQFGNSTVTTCYIGGSEGILNCTGPIYATDATFNTTDTENIIIRNPPLPCPVSGGKQSFQIDSNGSTRTCVADSDNVNGTDINILKINGTNATFENIYLGNSDVDHYIYFYDNNDPKKQYIRWEANNERFEISEWLQVGLLDATEDISSISSIYAGGDMYVTASDGCIWAGAPTQANALFRVCGDGNLFAENATVSNLNVTGTITSQSIQTDIINSSQYEDSSLVLWMDFNNNTLDSSQYGNDGTNNGAVLDKDVAEFDGVNDYINVTDDNSLDFDETKSLTMTAWIKSTDADSQKILVKRDGTNQGFKLLIVSGRLDCYFEDDDTENIGCTDDGVTNMDDGNWHFVTFVYNVDEDTITRYADSFQTGTIDNRPVTLDNMATSTPLLIGIDSDGDDFFNGSIDSVKLYNRALSEAEIQREYALTNKDNIHSNNIYTKDLNVSNELTVEGESNLYDNVYMKDNKKFYFGDADDVSIGFDGNDLILTGEVGSPFINLSSIGFGGNIDIEDTTSSTTGVIQKETNRFIHNFHHPTGQSAVPDGFNTFIGVNAGNFQMGSTATSTSQASYNTGIGENSLRVNTLGSYNLGIGSYTLSQNTIGNNNLAIGSLALLPNTIGDYNTAIGSNALRQNKGGDYNTGIGAATLYWNKYGNKNVAMGIGAGLGTGFSNYSNNILIGYYAGKNILDGANNNLLIGHNIILQTAGGSNQMSIGNLIFGTGIDGEGTTVSSGNIGIGTSNPTEKLVVIGNVNITGVILMSPNITIGAGAKATKIDSIAIGVNAEATNTQSIAIGSGTTAYEPVSSGVRSIAIGYGTDATGQDSLAIGAYSQATANNAFALGRSAYAPGAGTTSIGYYTNSEGTSATAISIFAQALGVRSVAIGAYSNASGHRTTIVGVYSSARGSNSVAIGYNASTTATASNSIVIGSQVTNTIADSTRIGTDVHIDGNVGIGTTTPSHKLNVIGSLNATGNYTIGNFKISSIGSNLYFYNSSGSQIMRLNESGGLAIRGSLEQNWGS